MESISPRLKAERMNGEFFIKDVYGDYGDTLSHPEPKDMVRTPSNFSLVEVDDSGSSSEVNGQKDNQSLSFLEAYKNGSSFGQQPEDLIGGATVGTKGASFKEVQWSAFSVDSQQFGLGDFESVFFFGNGDCGLVNPEPFVESKSPLIENTAENIGSNEGSYEQQYAQPYNSVGEQNAGLKEMKNCENLYPGWRHNTITGQCYQLDDCSATADTQSDNFYMVSTNTQRSSEAKVHNTSEGSILEILDAVNLQQTSEPDLETKSEVNSISKSTNHVSQDNQVYPSNMVFDPQYPEWYYDTITKMWCTLESYNHALHCASNATQDPLLTTNENALAEVLNASDGSASEMRDVVNLQQNSLPVLETVFEESCALNNRNQYPPNMVFDPQYPEWYYDMFTQSWYTLESYNHALDDASNVTQDRFAANVNALDKVQNAFEGPVPEILDAVNLQQTTQPVSEAISEKASVSNSDNQGPQDSIGYTSSMVFDPHYPGWYYDRISQMWHTLESYNHALHDASNATQGLVTKNANVLAGLSIDEQPLLYGSHAQSGPSAMLEKSRQKGDWNVSASGFNKQSRWEEKTGHEGHWNASGGGYGLPSMWQEQTSKGSHQDKKIDSINLEPILKLNYGRSNLTSASSYVSSESIDHVSHPNMKLCANSIYSQFSFTPNAGRPPHALVAFGFGGKIIVMKDDNLSNSSSVSGSLGSAGGVILIHTLVDVLMNKADFLNSSVGYFHALCHESFPGPLVGGNAAAKDVNKWINDRTTSSESSSMDFQNGLLLNLLLSLLKILCQHNGRLRSPYGINPSHEGSDGPESAVSKLFASAKRSNAPVGAGSSMHCMTNPPSEANIRATATEVQNLLVSGRRKEALQCAQEGELWGTAVVLAAQLGEQFYADTVKQMALRQFVFGSPLRTLFLLIAGQPADVFSAHSSTSGSSSAVNKPYQCSEIQPNGLLDDWQENLAIIASNRTKDDELVIIHLGDSLWKERGEVTAAHACYLLAEVNFEPYSDSARLCLIGADHLKNTRTYACPDSIQRTEIYEYSKVLGNSQFVLLPFQPYKLVYAYMLAEVGKVSDSLRYCQASMKMLRYSGRSPEVELWRALFLSLEERLRNHQQSGYSTNLAPTKLVGKLFNSIDRSIHRMIGLPPLPPTLKKSGEDRDSNSLGQKVSSSQSATAITSLMSSPSIEAISEWTGDNGGKVAHNRSISEPNFGSTKKNDGSYGQGNASISGGPSRFGRFGFQLLQKTIGWVSRTRPNRQAKLGESNKFYYDEKLKRWVEEGAELPASEAFLPPPPIAASFQNGKSDYDVKNALKSNGLIMDAKQEKQLDAPSEQVFGLPPVPPSQNQFSARNKGGVRSRYVDTFNKRDGSVTSTFQSPSAPSVKPLSSANFFIPSAPASYEDQTSDASTRSSTHETTITEEPFPFVVQESIFSPSST